MALTDIQLAQVQKLFTQYCAKRVPPAVQSKLRVSYRIDGNAVLLFEERPAFPSPHDWHETPVAKFTYVETPRQWRLYCQHRDLRWHSYRALPTASSLAKLLDEVNEDPTGIFWG
jgi:hypothetical protein